jgi:hypothetical protein
VTRNEARNLHVSTALVGLSGLVYGWMRYFAQSDDPFSVVGHPWQPELHAAHVLTAPLLVFACALVWRAHVWLRVRGGFQPRRQTGLVLALSLAPMILSGYAIQVTIEETWREFWIVLHVASSVLWLLAYGVHQLAPRVRAKPIVREELAD